MKIIKTKEKDLTSFRGRPPKYPFSKLEPGRSLVLDYTPDDLNRAKSALYQYKKSNGLHWQTCIRVNAGEIFINRIS